MRDKVGRLVLNGRNPNAEAGSFCTRGSREETQTVSEGWTPEGSLQTLKDCRNGDSSGQSAGELEDGRKETH